MRGRGTPANADGRIGAWQAVFLAALAFYFFVPLLAMGRFALQRVPVATLGWGNLVEGWSARPVVDAITDDRTLEMARRSLLLCIATIALTMVLLVPVAVYVEVQAPRLRGLVTALTLLPWVVPPIALVVGVAATFRETAPGFLSSLYSLVPFYSLWALPFSYRAIDAGLRAIDVRTLHEAARSLGASWPVFFVRVLVPNLSSSLLVMATLTAATVLGEFAFAALLLKETLPTHLVVLQGSDPRAGLGVGLVVLAGTAVIIGFTVGLLRRRGIAFNAAGV